MPKRGTGLVSTSVQSTDSFLLEALTVVKETLSGYLMALCILGSHLYHWIKDSSMLCLAWFHETSSILNSLVLAVT